jgi:hypothetical protein
MTPAQILVSAVTLSALAVLVAGAAAAQGPDAGALQEIREAMHALPAFEGRWRGEGWMRRGPQEPSHFVSEETVEARLDGQILTIEGIHHAKADPSREVFHAFAVLSYDPEADTYRFRSHTGDGRGGDYEGRVDDGAFIWGHEVPGGKMRYVLRIREDRWEEVGELSSDGESWHQFFEMKLERLE